MTEQEQPIRHEAGTKRRCLCVLFAAFSIGITACSDANDPTPRSLAGAATSATSVNSVRPENPANSRDRQARVAQSIPEFAGLYTDAEGKSVVMLTDTSAGPRALAALRAEFGMSALRSPRVQAAKYNYARLYQEFPNFRASMLSVPFRSVSIAIDEATNHLLVLAENADHAAKLRAKLARIPLPSDMVEVRVGGEIVQLADLNDRFRPVTAAYITNNYAGGLRFVCTMGLIVHTYAGNGMISNSHCTPSLNVDGTVFYQNPDNTNPPSPSDIIGTEIFDPTPTPCTGVDYETQLPFTGGCRWADAMLVQLNAGVTANPGYIARTTTGTTVGSPPWRIVGSDPEFQKNVTVFSKTGRRTGTTSGVITEDCIDFGVIVGGSPVLFKCQGYANISARPGDSGSPIWRPYPSLGADAVVVVGIMWGGRNCDANHDNCQSLIYSPMNGVNFDTGAYSGMWSGDIRP